MNSPIAFVCLIGFVFLSFFSLWIYSSSQQFFKEYVLPFREALCQLTDPPSATLPTIAVKILDGKMYHIFSCKPPISCQMNPRPHEVLTQHRHMCPKLTQKILQVPTIFLLFLTFSFVMMIYTLNLKLHLPI